MDLSEIVDAVCEPEDLKKFEKIYVEQQDRGSPSSIATFSYAHCLIRSSKSQVKLGIGLLNELLHSQDDDVSAKRDYLYYLALAHTRIKEYDDALKYVNTLLQYEEKNMQAQNLKEFINKRMKRDGLLGAAILAGGVSLVGGLLLAGYAVMSTKK